MNFRVASCVCAHNAKFSGAYVRILPFSSLFSPSFSFSLSVVRAGSGTSDLKTKEKLLPVFARSEIKNSSERRLRESVNGNGAIRGSQVRRGI